MTLRLLLVNPFPLVTAVWQDNLWQVLFSTVIVMGSPLQGAIEMESVFVLWHVHRLPNGDDDEKLIGVYRNDDEAREAISRVLDKPGFRDCRDGFLIDEYKLGEDHWTEGYATV